MQVVPFITLALGAVQGVMTIMGSRQEEAAAQSRANAIQAQGEADQAAAESQARQHEIIAKQERANAQRAFAEEKRQAGLARSRALAVSSAQGGSLDPTTTSVLGRLEAEGQFNAMTALAEGETRAINEEYSAEVARMQGENASSVASSSAAGVRSAAKAKANLGIAQGVVGVASSGASWYSKYGDQVFKPTGGGLQSSFYNHPYASGYG